MAGSRPVIGAAFSVTLASAQGGDETAFACLFRDVQPALLRYLHVITPEAEDVAGETWLQVVKGLPGFRGGEEAFRAWLFTIARHRAVDAGRSRSRRSDVPLAVTDEVTGQPMAPDAAELALEAISTRSVVALIKTLPREHAEIIMLRVVAGLEAADVARIVGKTPGAVRVTAHRALRRLAELTEPVGPSTTSKLLGRHDEIGKLPFPGRPGTEDDQPLLDMIITRRHIPLDAPAEMHKLARVLDLLAGPAESGELAGEAAVRAAFNRSASPAGISSGAQRPARPRRSRRRGPFRRRTWIASPLAAIVVGLSAVFIVGSIHFAAWTSCCATKPSPARPSEQDIYAAALRQDLQSLDVGVLTYSPIRSLETSATTDFKAVVTDIGQSPRRTTRLTEYRGMVVYQQDVPTGGIVGIEIVDCENLKCLSESSSKQAVLSRGDSATWHWRISAGTPGAAEIVLRADTYDQGSNQTLSEEIIQVSMKVSATIAYTHQQNNGKIARVTTSIVGDIETAGAIAGAILAVGGVVGLAAKKKRNQVKGKPKPDEAGKDKTEDA